MTFRKINFLEKPTSVERPNCLPTFDIKRADTKHSIFWDVTQGSELNCTDLSDGYAADGGSMFLQNVHKFLPDKSSRPRTQYAQNSPLLYLVARHKYSAINLHNPVKGQYPEPLLQLSFS